MLKYANLLKVAVWSEAS